MADTWTVRVQGGYQVKIDAASEDDAKEKALSQLIHMGHSLTAKDMKKVKAEKTFRQ